MSETRRQFQLIGEDAPAPAAPPASPQADQAARALLLTALRALSQRAQIAITNLFSLFLVASVWLLASRVLDAPTQDRLVALFGYAVFALAIDVVRRRHK